MIILLFVILYLAVGVVANAALVDEHSDGTEAEEFAENMMALLAWPLVFGFVVFMIAFEKLYSLIERVFER